MSRYKVVIAVAVVCLLGAIWVGQALSQEAEAEGRGGARSRRWDPERMRQRYEERIKEVMGITDEEWKVLQPRLEKVQTLSRQARGRGGMRGMFGRRGRSGGRPEATGDTRERSKVEKAVEQLRTTLENEDAKPKEIKSMLTALRKAREKAKQELAKAQKELSELLTVRQEAQLVLMGMLD